MRIGALLHPTSHESVGVKALRKARRKLYIYIRDTEVNLDKALSFDILRSDERETIKDIARALKLLNVSFNHNTALMAEIEEMIGRDT